MRIPFTLRILMVLAGLACLVGPALLIRERVEAAARSTSGSSSDLGVAVVRAGGSLK
jgi:hypothetical protein